MDERSGESIGHGRWRWAGLLDFGARWFRDLAERRGGAPLGEHGHWDPVRRDWRYHTHDSDAERSA